MLDNKSILITGGTGSLGKALIAGILKKYPGVDRVIIYSRDEQKQSEMSQRYSREDYPQLSFLIGDVRDRERLIQASKGVHFIIHAAAMKYVPIAESNPMECIKTNIIGAENIVKASLENKVERVVSLSTDKASAPISLYGATKLASDKLFVAGNTLAGNNNSTIFSVVRYGNVMGSSGSVIPFFLKRKKETGILPITNSAMTRFNISLESGMEMIMYALENSWGGEIFVPKIPSYKIIDLAAAICPDCETKFVGIRPGEKVHEDMITQSDAFYTYDIGNYYVILPATRNWKLDEFIQKFNAKKVPETFEYNSGNNKEWESVEKLRLLIRTHVDKTFEI